MDMDDTEDCLQLLIDTANSCFTDPANDALVKLFNQFDEDKDDVLSPQELNKMEKALRGKELSKEQQDQIFERFSNNQQHLDVDGFLDLYFEHAYQHPVDAMKELEQLGFGDEIRNSSSPPNNDSLPSVHIRPRQFHLKYEPPVLAMSYELIVADQVLATRLHKMDLSWMSDDHKIDDICSRLFQEHSNYVHPATVSVAQLKRLIHQLQEHAQYRNLRAPVSGFGNSNKLTS